MATFGATSSSATVDKALVGLSNVDNTSDAAKPVSSAIQTALDAKQATLVSGTNVKTVNGASVIGSGDLTVSGSAPVLTPFTQDLGVARQSGSFDLTGLSGLTPDKPVMVFQSSAAIASKGNARDEAELDHIDISGYVFDTTTIRCTWRAPTVVVGTYAFVYLVGA